MQVTQCGPDGAWRLPQVSGVRKGECSSEMERDLPTDPMECASLMNSSVTQLIAKPATDLAVTSSPLNPTAGLLEHRTVCIIQWASGGRWEFGKLIVFGVLRKVSVSEIMQCECPLMASTHN